MSKLKLLGSSSGHTMIQAPAAAGSNTLTLPANNGTANQVLSNSGTAGILQFANGGKLLQIAGPVLFSSTNAININHNSGGAVGPSYLGDAVKITIQPTAVTSKILYFLQFSSVGSANGNATMFIKTHLYRHTSGQSNVDTGASCGTYVANNTYSPHVIVWLDSPNTTNSIEYKLYGSGSGATGGQYAWQRTNGSTQIIAAEIGA